MTLKFKKGDAVRQVMPAPIAGEVVSATIAEDDVSYLVRTAEGVERWFKSDDIEAVPPVDPEQ